MQATIKDCQLKIQIPWIKHILHMGDNGDDGHRGCNEPIPILIPIPIPMPIPIPIPMGGG